jgi:beta-lactamase regulating signal transducer with metallopeptidase domain
MGQLSNLWLNGLGRLGQASLQGAVLVCVILLVQVLLRQHLPGRWRYALWLLLVLRLAIPWAPESRLSVFNLLAHPEAPAASHYLARISHDPAQVPEWAKAAAVEPSLPSSQAHMEASASSGSQVAAPAGQRNVMSGLTWRFWLKCIWLLGVGTLLLGSFRGSLRLRRIVKMHRPVTESSTLNLLEDCKEQMGVHTIIGLVESDQIACPAIFGFMRPRLLVPQGLLRKLSRDELRFVFLHELAHLKRYDVLLGWITLLLQVIHWFNPLVWLAFYRMRTDREIACDQEVLRHVSEPEVTSYGKTILVLLNHFSQRQYLPSLVGILEHKTQAQRRIKMIASFKRETPRVSAWALALVVLLSTVVLTNARPQTEDETSELFVTRQPRMGRYQFIFTGETTNGRGSAKGSIDYTVAENGVYLKGGGSQTGNTPMIPMGTIAMYHLRNPSLMLKFPLQPGAEWTDRWTGYEATTRLFIEQVPISLGVKAFSDCLLIETTIEESPTRNPDHSRFVINSTCGKRYIWLAPGVGIVRMIYEHKDGTTTKMLLTGYEIGADTQEYLPTVHNATWDYLFKSDAHTHGVKEKWRLSDTRRAGHLSHRELFPKPKPLATPEPVRRPGQSEAAYQATLRAWHARNRASQRVDQDAAPAKRPGQSEAAYRAALRAYRAKKARTSTTQAVDQDAPPTKRAGQSEAAYQAAWRAYQAKKARSSTTRAVDQDAPPTKRAGQSEAAYQAALRAYRAKKSRTSTTQAVDPLLPKPVKRAGQSEAAYQAALRAWRAKTRKGPYSTREVILTKNGESSRFRAWATAQTRAGKHLAEGRFTFAPSASRLLCLFSGSTGSCPEPLPYYMVWVYICHKERKLLELPVTPGGSWRQAGENGASAETSIEGYETVTVEAGTFSDCVKHVTVISDAHSDRQAANDFANGIRTLWFAPGVGLVKMVYTPDNGKVTEAELLRFEITEQSSDYMPLAAGNEWTYSWTNDYRDYDVIETIRIPVPGEVVKMYVPDSQTAGPDWKARDRDL